MKNSMSNISLAKKSYENQISLNGSLTDLGWLLRSEAISAPPPAIPLKLHNTAAKLLKEPKKPKKENRDWERDTTIKPPFSFVALIYLTLKTSKKAKLSLNDICTQITQNFAYYRHTDITWKNAIKQHIQLHPFFKKITRKNGDPNKVRWTIDPSVTPPPDYQPLHRKVDKARPMKAVSTKKKALKDSKTKAVCIKKEILADHEERLAGKKSAGKEGRTWSSLLGASFGDCDALMEDGTESDYEVPSSPSSPQSLPDETLDDSFLLFTNFPSLNSSTIKFGMGSAVQSPMATSFSELFPDLVGSGGRPSSLGQNSFTATGHNSALPTMCPFSLSSGLIVTGTEMSIYPSPQDAPLELLYSSGEDDDLFDDGTFQQPYPSDWIVETKKV